METAALENQAVKAALIADWEKAIRLNLQILASQPKDTAALNRLAKAYWKTGQLTKAKKNYERVLQISPYNPLAAKNLKRLKTQRHKTKQTTTALPLNELPRLFLEEPGKTKIVKLIRLTAPKILAEIDSADKVTLKPRKRLVTVNRLDNTYLGSLPEDLSQRLNTLIKGGNRYTAHIKSVDRHSLEIFIKETHRAPRFKNIPSFVHTGTSYLNINFDQ